MSRRYRFAGTFMQSFSSMGPPMLNFAGLYPPLIIGASGYYAPFVALLATVASLLTVYAPPYVLSKRYVTNGGYYSYSGIAFGGQVWKVRCDALLRLRAPRDT
ncbi:hypothetical protein [Thermogymnomonas acidicola]|uniref:hypothetical protein n=1 Tax=Thermogymnomonas acidicola TaxID=399579 RepID=UPI0009465E63|nr:hypothetical protein [Thermogymnomonas acidicola]